MRNKPFLVALLVVTPACRLDRRTELLENQYLVARLDNSTAAQQHMEEEYRREQEHVRLLEAQVDDLIEQEEALAAEALDMELAVEEALAELKELEEEAEQLAQLGGERMAAIQAERDSLKDVRESGDRTRIEQRLADLMSEVDALQAALAALPQPEPAVPPDAPAADPPPPADPEGGGGP